MNNKRRELLGRAVSAMNEAERYTSMALDEEQECLDNMPENLYESDGYAKMESAIENLESALENISGAVDCIMEASS